MSKKFRLGEILFSPPNSDISDNLTEIKDTELSRFFFDTFMSLIKIQKCVYDFLLKENSLFSVIKSDNVFSYDKTIRLLVSLYKGNNELENFDVPDIPSFDKETKDNNFLSSLIIILYNTTRNIDFIDSNNDLLDTVNFDFTKKISKLDLLSKNEDSDYRKNEDVHLYMLVVFLFLCHLEFFLKQSGDELFIYKDEEIKCLFLKEYKKLTEIKQTEDVLYFYKLLFLISNICKIFELFLKKKIKFFGDVKDSLSSIEKKFEEIVLDFIKKKFKFYSVDETEKKEISEKSWINVFSNALGGMYENISNLLTSTKK